MEHALWLGYEADSGGCVLLWGAKVAEGADSGDACSTEIAVVRIGYTNKSSE